MGGSDETHAAVPKGLPVFVDRAACYQASLEAIQGVVDAQADFVSALANTASVLFYNLNAFAGPTAPLHELVVNWVGFYLLASPQELVLSAFQGKLACQRIKVGRGVCGKAILMKRSEAVPDVHAVPGHIACDAGSESEVVVLIRERTSQRVVGLLDIDSTQRGMFSDADLAPLAAICDHLGAVLEGRFPLPPAAPLGAPMGADMPAALHATRLPTAIPAFAVGRGATSVPPGATRAPPPPTAARTGGPLTTVHHHPPNSTSQPKPETTVADVAGWEFQSVRVDLMLRSADFPVLEASMGVKMLPEVIFNDNRLNFICPLQQPGSTTRVGLVRYRVSAVDALRDAARFYKSDAFKAIRSDVALPATAAWDKFRSSMQSFDPDIDWAFRNRYVGAVEFTPIDAVNGKLLAPVAVEDPASAAPSRRIDWAMLKRTDLKIKFFAAFDLFEDDLHDSGVSKMSVKSRVMDTCFFVLVRHVVRVDGMVLIVRDVRVFHDFASSPPTVVFEETEKQVTMQERIDANPGVDAEHLRRQMAREDECAEFLRTTFERTSYVELPTSA